MDDPSAGALAGNGNPDRKSGRPAKLSREAVIDAAQAVVERDGADSLTMRAIGTELGASTMALYRHVNSKEDVLVALLDRAAQQVQPGALPEEPRARLTALCQLLHDELAARPWAVPVLANGSLIGPSVLWLIEDIVASFRACGLDAAAAYRAYRIVWRYIVGELTVPAEAGAPSGQPGQVLDNLDAARFPALTEGRLAGDDRTGDSGTRDTGIGDDERDTFAPGLAAVLDGLTRHL